MPTPPTDASGIDDTALDGPAPGKAAPGSLGNATAATDTATGDHDPAFWPDGVVWRPVSPALATVRRLGVLAGTIPLLGGVGLLWWWTDGGWLVWVLAVVVLGLPAWSWVVIGRAVRSWGYAEREDDLLVRHGVLVRRLTVVPYGRMQFVDVTAGPVERAAGIATVQLHTAAAATDAAIPGLEPTEAARLRDRLAALGEQRAAGL